MEETWTLLVEQELRIEIDFGQEIQVRLEEGNAERFGEEIPLKSELNYTGPSKFAIFTWHGCVIKLTGTWLNVYKSET